MKALCKTIPLAVLMILSLPSFCYGAWIWTPETGGWSNPKHAVKDTAEEQFKWAMESYKNKDYKKAISEFDKLVKLFSNSKYAPDAQYYVGRAYEDMEEYYHAYLAYQKVIEAYPYAKNRDEIIKRQYDIGVLFYGGHKSKILGIALLPAIDKAIEIFEQVVKNSPYGEYAPKAQFKIGEAYKKENRFAEATVAFQKLRDEYPNDELAIEADYQIAQCGYIASLDASYNQESTDSAIDKFKALMSETEDKPFLERAKKSLKELKEKRAQSVYETARFYEKIGRIQSAAIYYKEIVKEYPETTLAKEALVRIVEIEKSTNKATR